jgi:hypothetical protein
MTVAWNFLAVHVPRNKGFAETMLSLGEDMSLNEGMDGAVAWGLFSGKEGGVRLRLEDSTL